MAQMQHRVNLTSPTFPLLTENFGRTVVGKPRDEASAEGDTPQVYYCHNVFPIKEGFESVGYKNIVNAINPADIIRGEVVQIKGDAHSRIYLAWSQTGEVYALKPGASDWIKLPATVPVTTSFYFDVDTISIGTVNGVSYIYYKGISAFTYNETTDSLDAVTLSGLTLSEIIGITDSYGYLIAYSETANAWSSTLDPTDFVPSAVTGAGGGSVAGIGGAIRFCFSNSLGFLIYTETNVIAATYTGNSRAPFKYREVDGSKGGLTTDLVAYTANSYDQYVYSRAGLQAVSSTKASTFLPEFTDFIVGDVFEDFDESTLTFSVQRLSSPMVKKIKFIASRYLIISYGVTSLTHVVVYDTILGRMGKLKIPHVYCFEYATGTGEEVAKEAIAFLSSDGSIKLVDFSSATVQSGVILAGKYQLMRSRLTTLQEVQVENVKLASDFSVHSLYSLDGKTLNTVAGYQASSVEGLRKYYFKTTAVDHSILMVGAFKATSILLYFNLNGKR